MMQSEDRKIILRGMSRRLVETLLLILGLALGIGASAAGIALVSRSIRSSEQLLSSPQYREIIVSSREESSDMDVPVVLNDDEEIITLTSLDLHAAEGAPDIAYAYIKQRTEFRNTAAAIERFKTMNGGEGAAGSSRGEGAAGDPSGTFFIAPGPGMGPPPLDDSQLPGAEGAPPAGEEGQQREDIQRDAERMRQSLLSLADIDLDGPQPVLDSWYGYEVSPEYFNAWGLHAKEGSLFTLDDIRMGANYMVLGSELAKVLFEDGQALGRKIINRMELYTITGVLEATGTEADNMAFTPAFMPDIQGSITDTAVPGMMFMRWNTSLSFMTADPSRLDEAAEQLKQYFEREYGAGMVSLSIPREEAEALRNRNNRMVTVILFLALAGLLIAGVNVSNILLSRALRRQKTVGILKALGSSKRMIFRLFFLESLIIGSCATAAGIGISIALARLMQETTGLAAVSPIMLAAGIGISWIISSILTVFPALQASKIPAAEAMRTQ